MTTDAEPRTFAEIYDPFGPETVDDPYPAWEQLGGLPPTWSTTIAPYLPGCPRGTPALLVSRHKDALEALRDPALDLPTRYVDLNWPPEPFREDDPSGWPVNSDPMLFGTSVGNRPRARVIAAKAMTTRRVRLKEPLLRALVRERLAPLLQRGECEFMEDFCRPFIVRLFSRGLLGMSEEVSPAVTVAFDTPIKVFMDALGLSPMHPEERIALGAQMLALRNYTVDLIERRRTDPGDDIISDLVHAEPAVSEPDILNLVAQVFRGFDQPFFTLGLMVEQLLEDPARWEALVEDRSLVPAAVEECFRRRPSIMLLQTRLAYADTSVGGVPVPKGAMVGIHPGAANHDPAVFEDPAAFCPGRANAKELLTFSKGEHGCLGIKLAYVETRIVLEELLDRLVNPRLAEPKPPRARHLFHGPGRVPITWEGVRDLDG